MDTKETSFVKYIRFHLRIYYGTSLWENNSLTLNCDERKALIIKCLFSGYMYCATMLHAFDVAPAFMHVLLMG